MFKSLAGVALLAVGLSTSSDASTWKVDKAHSYIGFTAKHLVVSKVKGNFKEFDGTVNFDGQSLQAGGANFTVNLASIDTDNGKRDEHLRSSDFFEVEKYPTMTFVSTSVSDVQGNKFKLNGNLTIKDVTKPVVFDCEYVGSVIDDPWGNRKTGFSATTTINRFDYKVSWNNALETGALVVGEDITISVELELVEEKPAAQ